MDLVIWPHCLGNVVELVTWECRHDRQHELDNLAMWTGQFSEIKLAKQKNSNVDLAIWQS